jgi:hypothetical protein
VIIESVTTDAKIAMGGHDQLRVTICLANGEKHEVIINCAGNSATVAHLQSSERLVIKPKS